MALPRRGPLAGGGPRAVPRGGAGERPMSIVESSFEARGSRLILSPEEAEHEHDAGSSAGGSRGSGGRRDPVERGGWRAGPADHRWQRGGVARWSHLIRGGMREALGAIRQAAAPLIAPGGPGGGAGASLRVAGRAGERARGGGRNGCAPGLGGACPGPAGRRAGDVPRAHGGFRRVRGRVGTAQARAGSGAAGPEAVSRGGPAAHGDGGSPARASRGARCVPGHRL